MKTLGSRFMAAAILAAGLASSVQADPVEDHARALVDDMAEGYPALNATVMVDGEIVWEAEGGVQRSQRDGVDADYNFYSSAKLLTGMAYARLEQDGLDLDQPVRDIDPDLPAHYQRVTLRQLLSHTAGVRHYEGPFDWMRFSGRRCDTPADAIGHFIDDPLKFEPGTDRNYSTYGFVLLSHLLVQLTGEADFDAAMHAALGNTYRANTDSVDAEKADNYRRIFGFWNRIGGLSAECKFGAGGLIASSRDLARMGSELAAGAVIDPAVLDAALETADNGGVGEAMGGGYDADADMHYVAHSGGSPGGRSYLVVLIEPQVAVALTGNYDGDNLGGLALSLARLFAGIDDPAEE